MAGIGDSPTPSQDREVTDLQEQKSIVRASVVEMGTTQHAWSELTDLQEQKINAQASVAEAENAVIISSLLVIAFELVRKRSTNSFLYGSKSPGAQVCVLCDRRRQ